MAEPKAVNIEVRFEDGSMLRASGDTAAEVWSWLRGCELMSCIHGAAYKGPLMQKVPAPNAGDTG